MADFRQLALDFVLEDAEPKQTHIAQQAAKEIESATPSSNPVARWVEAVQPWMPGTNDDEVMLDANETPDWTARAKSLEFLSRTLDFLGPDVLKASQVQLLVAFFGAMFDVDHKAGILASAAALSRIVAMKAFRPSGGREILQKVCALKDDFPRQIAKTRLAVYELLRSLMSMPAVAKDLQQKDGADATFMKDLLTLCQSERDPDCLIIWFDILRLFLTDYSPSKEMLEEVYGTFKAYFPITLPRMAQSGVTPDELKQHLRNCFTSNHKLASLALPFLIGKLDQGDGVTVNVKVDVLRTIKACLETYQEPQESITPFTNRIWTSLKYEVRNGEVEDTIWATLEVLKTLTIRLEGDDLRDYTLNVTRDCVPDLATPMYANAAGRLLVSVLSAKPEAFVLMVAPTVTHIKENLRHPKSPTHNLDLLKILHVLLESRLLITGLAMTEQERSDFTTVDGVFKTLYDDVYRSHLSLGSAAEVYEDNIKKTTESVEGVGALLCQQHVNYPAATETIAFLNTDTTCTEACDALFLLATRSWSDEDRKAGADMLVNETTKALQRVVQSHPRVFGDIVARGMALVRHTAGASGQEAADIGRSMISFLAFVGCSSVSGGLNGPFSHYLALLGAAVGELITQLEKNTNQRLCSSILEGVHSIIRYFNDACLEQGEQESSTREFSLTRITRDYPQLSAFGAATDASMNVDAKQPELKSAAEAREDALLVGLWLTRQLYLQATQASGSDQLSLSSKLETGYSQGGNRYLYLLAELARFVIHELSESEQTAMQIESFAVNLFHENLSRSASWSWLVSEPLNILSFGILESLRPSRVSKLVSSTSMIYLLRANNLQYDSGVAQQILMEGIKPGNKGHPTCKPVKRSIIAVLANKHAVETLEPAMSSVQQTLQQSLTQIQSNTDAKSSTEEIMAILSFASGLLRRHTGKASQSLVQALRDLPANPQAGFRLGRRLEMIVAPQRFLTKDNFAVVRPLWLQKLYIELVKPLLEAALIGSDQLVRTNFGIAALLMVRNFSFSIYEEDAPKILRVAIASAQNFGCSAEGMAALQVIKNILVEAPEQAQDHIRSLIKICTAIFTNKAAGPRPEWLPAEYTSPATPAIEAGCGKLSLEIVGGLPRMFESRHLLAYEPQIQRDLSTACGHRIRELRGTARLARGAWADVQ